MNHNHLPLLQKVLSGVLLASALIWLPTSAARADVNLESEMQCLALNIYHEARGEPSDGLLAVGQVVVNRASDPRFPDTLCAVIQQGGSQKLYRCQFSWWCDGKSDQPKNLKAWKRSEALARRIIWGNAPDPTSGAKWYHTKQVRPIWRKALTKGPVIGSHIFYVNEKRSDEL